MQQFKSQLHSWFFVSETKTLLYRLKIILYYSNECLRGGNKYMRLSMETARKLAVIANTYKEILVNRKPKAYPCFNFADLTTRDPAKVKIQRMAEMVKQRLIDECGFASVDIDYKGSSPAYWEIQFTCTTTTGEQFIY